MFEAFRRGDLTEHEVVEAYLWLVGVNVRRFGERWREDLEQEGVMALYRAVNLFDIDRGLRFSTYAVHWLKQAFHAFLYNNCSTVRIPTYMRKVMARMAKGDEALDVNEATRAWAERLNEQQTGTMSEVHQPTSNDPEPTELPRVVSEALDLLSERERRLVHKRFWEHMKLREIGEEEGVTLERARQIIKRALTKMDVPWLREQL